MQTLVKGLCSWLDRSSDTLEANPRKSISTSPVLAHPHCITTCYMHACMILAKMGLFLVFAACSGLLWYHYMHLAEES